jgi:CRP/FNR family cyclic AMP-dependent transcriptional regulator
MTTSQERRRDTLARSPLFEALESRELDQLVAISRLQTAREREFIFRKGEEPDRICALTRGRARVTTSSSRGREIQIRILEEGDVFGEIAVLDDRPRTTDVIASEVCELIVIERGRFRQFLVERPKVAIKLLAVMAQKLRDTTALLEDNVFLKTPERVAKTLVVLANTRGVDDDEGTRIAILLSQAEIGTMAGCSRESVNRQLSRWMDEGILTFDQGEVVIQDLDRLEDLAAP